MVYIKHWAEFHSRALELYQGDPDRTRYLVKAHPARQWVVLKVTDNVTTLKYRSRSTVILNRFELLNRELTAKMAAQDQGVAPAGQGGEDRALGVSKDKTSASQVDVADAAVGQGAVGGAGGVGGSGQAASNSKKKKKKKGGNK